MHRAILAGSLLVCGALMLPGCSSPANRYSSELKTGLKALNELRFAYEKVKTNENVQGAAAEIKEISNRLLQIKTRIEEATPADDKLKEKILKKYSGMFEGILMTLQFEQARVGAMGLDQDTQDVSQKVHKAFTDLTRPEKKTTK
jgi:hypothetical protein